MIDEESRVVPRLIEHKVLLKPEEGSIAGVEASELFEESTCNFT